MNNPVASLMNKGTFDLTLSPQDELPPDVIVEITKPIPTEEKNRVPVIMYAAAQRYAAKLGVNTFKNAGTRAFELQFNIHIPTHEEIIHHLSEKEELNSTMYL